MSRPAGPQARRPGKRFARPRVGYSHAKVVARRVSELRGVVQPGGPAAACADNEAGRFSERQKDRRPDLYELQVELAMSKKRRGQ